MKKKFFPAWTADVMAVEDKLMKLSEEGLHLTDFSPITSVFTFEEGEKKPYRYRICIRRNCGGNVPKGYVSAGWERVCGSKHFYVARHEDTEIKKVPDYGNNKTVNRSIFYLLIVGLIYLFGFYLGFFAAIFESGDFGEMREAGFIGHVIFTVLFILLAVCFGRGNARIDKTSRELGITSKILQTVPDENFIYSADEEKAMLKAKTMMKKSPMAWFLEPDRAMAMVDKLAGEGWKFYRCSKTGNELYFIKAEPCRVKFVVDYQNVASDDYYAAALDDGWKLEFTSVTKVTTFIVWSKEFHDEDDEPEFYTDGESILSCAKRQMMTFAIPVVVMTIVLAVLIYLMMGFYFEEHSIFPLAISALYLFIIPQYVILAVKAIGYYLRMKKKYSG